MEEWAPIPEFPSYSISSDGQILNDKTGKVVKHSYTGQGAAKVGLFSDGKQHTRSVKHLVASVFVEGQTDIFDTAVNLDGDPDNNSADNLAWRPRWFAHKYSRQYREIGEWFLKRPVYEANTKEHYDDIVDAAIYNGLLMADILKSTTEGGPPCFPTGQRFVFAN